MSFNENDINNHSSINRTNYEEYFLLYMDGELTAAEKADVERFIADNSDLKPELELLLSTKIVPGTVELNKEELLAGQMQLNEMEEALVLYMDNELPEADRRAVEHTIDTNNNFQLHYQLLQKTKLPDERIIFPYKKELYRKTDSIRPVYIWLRIAAVFLILIGAAFFLWQQAVRPTPAISLVQPDIHIIQKDAVAKKQSEAPVHTVPAIASIPHKYKFDITNKTVAVVKKPAAKKHIKKEGAAIISIPNTNNDMAIHTIEEPVEKTGIQNTTPSKKISSPLAVTSLKPDTYTNKEATPTYAVSHDAVADNSSKDRKPLKIFLRKATRFIERTTNINPVNEDGELLIGAVSVKLQ